MNDEKLIQVFATALGIDLSEVHNNLEYNTIPQWDSVGHMGMIAGLEEAFDIMMDIDDIVDFESYTVGIEKLKNYDIVIE